MKKETRKTIAGGFAMTAISGLFNPIIQAGTKAIVDKLTYEVEISDWLYTLEYGLDKYFTNFPEVFYLNNANKPSFKKNISAFGRILKSLSSTITWKGYPITLTISPMEGKDTNQLSVTIMTINTLNAKKNLKNFLRECYRLNHLHEIKEASKEVSVYSIAKNGNLTRFWLNPFKKRTFDNVFIPDDQERIIKESLDKFISQRDWYINNNIPYHFGFLLYGEPGHGKGVLAQAIADYINAELIVFPGDAINQLPSYIGSEIQRNPVDKNAYRVVCIEDVDCGFAESKLSSTWDNDACDTKSVKRKVGLAEILNCLDGLNSPQNMIYILTTNHIEKLDPALIRPGRCDVKLEIPGVTYDTFKKFAVYHYGEGADTFIDDHFIKDFRADSEITFAELQTDVMKGKTLADIAMKVMQPTTPYPRATI